MELKRAAAASSRPGRGAWVLAATIIASSMAFIDMSVVNVALPVLQRSIGASFAEAQWVVEAYVLLLSALTLLGGTMGDIYGRRRIFALGILIFALASAACGFATTPAMLILARVAQGIGGALMVPGSLALIAALIPADKRGKAIGLWSACTGVMVAAAPALGGWLVHELSWRWVFLINLPLAVLALAILVARVPESRAGGGRGIDLPGAVLATLGLGGLTYGLIEAGRHSFLSPPAGIPILLGAIFLTLFILLEAHSDEPMIPLSLFRLPVFAGVQSYTFLLWAAIQGALFFVPFRLMQVQGFGPLQAGTALLPFVIVVSLLSRWTGILVDRHGARLYLVAGALLTGAGFLLLMLPDATTGYLAGFLPGLLVMGVGMGFCAAPVTVVALNSAGPEHVGVASAVNNMVARVGGLLAIAAFGLALAARFNVSLDHALDRMALPPAAVTALEPERSKLAAAELPPGLSEDQQVVLGRAIDDAFVEGYRWVMALAALLAFASAAIVVFTLGRRKDVKPLLLPGRRR
ncbi:MAG TPA: MFS transporter [Dongiaceae bacterium]|nr:MFS transporter [Dongiaceae bacterium]